MLLWLDAACVGVGAPPFLHKYPYPYFVLKAAAAAATAFGSLTGTVYKVRPHALSLFHRRATHGLSILDQRSRHLYPPA